MGLFSRTSLLANSTAQVDAANAADYILSKAVDKFTVENGAVIDTVFDPNQPGAKFTVEAFIEQQLREADFAFKPSGGGANPLKSAGGARRLTDTHKSVNLTHQERSCGRTSKSTIT
jgi:hypothetical protein